MVTSDDDPIAKNNHEHIVPNVNIERRNGPKKILIKGRKVKRLTKKLNELDESDEEFFNSDDRKKQSASKLQQQSDNSSEKSDDSKTFGLKFHNKLLNTGKILSHWNDSPQKIIVDMNLLERTNKIIQKIATVGLDNPSVRDESNFESKPLERWSSSVHSDHENDNASKTNPIVEEKIARIQQVEAQIARSELTKAETIFYDKKNCTTRNVDKNMEKSKEIFDKTLALNDTAQVLKNFSTITNSWLSGLSSATKIVGEATKTAASSTMNHAAKHLVNAQNIILTNASAAANASLPVSKNLTHADRLIFGHDNQPQFQASNVEQDFSITNDWVNNDDWDDEPIILAKKSQTVLNETTEILEKEESIDVSNDKLDNVEHDDHEQQLLKISESNSDSIEKTHYNAIHCSDDGWGDWDDVDETIENIESINDSKSENDDDKTSEASDQVDEILDQISFPSEIVPLQSEMNAENKDHPPLTIALNNDEDEIFGEWNDWGDKEIEMIIPDKIAENDKQESMICSAFDIEKPFCNENISDNPYLQFESENLKDNMILAETKADLNAIKEEKITTVIETINDCSVSLSAPPFDVIATTSEKSLSDHQNDDQLQIEINC
ncbi:hypothetical protein BLA29_001040 [Euroglyphus maynei]|uniref:Uncharacterized protein n=1 Tax=Euroglyphus maynei TaxID=6958 RepID=A0A1Y3AXV5_EURMA|nr:hypothetical protein BLA29_001040 [Euroglyphus maynei]